jgi:hypothetical protein
METSASATGKESLVTVLLRILQNLCHSRHFRSIYFKELGIYSFVTIQGARGGTGFMFKSSQFCDRQKYFYIQKCMDMDSSRSVVVMG